MRLSLPRFFNNLITFSGKLANQRYHRFVNEVELIQTKKLLHYLKANRDTVFGKMYHFEVITSYASYAENIPVIEDWKQVESFIIRMENGEEKILTVDPVRSFEETSGSAGFSKLIPYNRALKKEFQKALQTWMVELQKTYPAAFYGRSYWSLSPVLKEPRFTSSGIRIGLESDAEYFNPFVRFLVAKTMAVDSSVIKIKDGEAFYFETLRQLLCARDLSFVSVWSPTFFLQMDTFLRKNIWLLIKAVSNKDSTRACEINDITKNDFTWKDLWPHLALISCWTHAQAMLWLPALRKAAGGVSIQPKGLLSTEGVVSIPIKEMDYPALAYHSHFFEFRQIDSGKIYLAHQLTKDEKYEIIITTGGGLYRYATKDIVQVQGFYLQVPLLKFLGRQNRTSDIVGEKVSELQVIEIMERIGREGKAPINILFLKADMTGPVGQYTLYVEGDSDDNNVSVTITTARFESMLCKNPYYNQALRSRQLLPMRYENVDKGFKERLAKYYGETKRIKDGDVKLPALFLYNELGDLTF